ncbi:HAD family hydrolase [Thermovenabulum sp.]|uniref:HAD family hydrolase n=1 Tax=Thermovenabulum sp. TaxID=3100335 RepID=UPI003C7DCC26
MIDTLLFDLDGTLLPLDTDEFINSYLKLIARKMSKFFDPQQFIDLLLDSTMAMVNNLDPSKTNKEVFWEAFFSNNINIEKEILQFEFEEFYDKDFPSLKKVLKPHPFPNKILKTAFLMNYDVVIATNPIFPLNAIKQRLRWINSENFPYRLITSYEIMHFTKPHIQYYEEILSIIKKSPENCLMIGNDVEEDLIVRKLGVKTFLLKDYMINRNNKKIISDYSGSFNDLLNLIINLRERGTGVERL